VQKISAGTGIRHSELNPSPTEPLRFLQVWIVPERAGLPPSYEQKSFSEADKRGRLKLIGSNDARQGSIAFEQDVAIYASILGTGEAIEHGTSAGRGVWVQIVRGSAIVNGERLDEGDGAALVGEPSITLRGATPCELLLFDLA
jgi:redox-sensitive bicupin YhaK (pirin superfamily)